MGDSTNGVQTGGAAADRAELARRDGDHWHHDLEGTLLFLLSGDDVLLIDKLTGHGAGKINGPGGKRDPGETPLECAVRETREEVGVRVSKVEQRAQLKFIDTGESDWLGHVFVAGAYHGTPVRTREADPFWCPVRVLPLDRMWPDDRIWLPRVLAGERLTGSFLFDRGELKAYRVQRRADDWRFD